ncbi:MAG: endonuclease [Synergistaceae bacterium]
MNCGIDPGRFKIGFAAEKDGALLFSAIIPKSEEEKLAQAIISCKWELLSPWLKEGSITAILGKRAKTVIIGDGTSSEEIEKLLGGKVPTQTADEYGTTLEGRKLYWYLHPPKGLWKIIPTSLRTPPRDVDDLAAWAIIKNTKQKMS